jgi:hypothetical protein
MSIAAAGRPTMTGRYRAAAAKPPKKIAATAVADTERFATRAVRIDVKP